MNQILDKKHIINEINVEFSNEIFEISYNENKRKLKKYINYRFQFIASAFIAILCCFIFLYNIIKSNNQEKISKKLLNNYNLTTLYQDTENLTSYSTNEPFVIGIIRINKLNLNYPILSQTNNDLLKVSLCRFSGPMPNENGNLCIVGHNYIDDRFFSKLYLLENGDIIEIYDLSGNNILYEVNNKYEVNANDLTCTNQISENIKIITLITCDNLNNSKRLVVQAKEKRTPKVSL